MKKIVSAILSCAMIAGCLTSCGKKYDDKFIGKWEASEMVVDGTSYEDFMGVPLNAMFQFDIQDNGKGEWHSPMSGSSGGESDMRMEWDSGENGSIDVTAYIENDSESEQKFSMVYDNGELTFTEDDVEFHMKKVDSFTQYSQDELTGMYNNTINSLLTSGQ